MLYGSTLSCRVEWTQGLEFPERRVPPLDPTFLLRRPVEGEKPIIRMFFASAEYMDTESVKFVPVDCAHG